MYLAVLTSGVTRPLWATAGRGASGLRLDGYLRSIAQIRHFLDADAAKTLIHALVTSRIDYANSLLIGVNKSFMHRLQLVQNSAARLITRTAFRNHITPILFQLHWLPVEYRVRFKVLVLF